MSLSKTSRLSSVLDAIIPLDIDKFKSENGARFGIGRIRSALGWIISISRSKYMSSLLRKMSKHLEIELMGLYPLGRISTINKCENLSDFLIASLSIIPFFERCLLKELIICFQPKSLPLETKNTHTKERNSDSVLVRHTQLCSLRCCICP